MKTGKLLKVGRRALIGVCASLGLGLAPGLVMADGTEALGVPSIPILNGSEAATTATSLSGGNGLLTINLPANATIKQVLLYWEGRRLDTESGQDENSLFLISDSFEGAVVGKLIGGPSAEFDSLAATNARPRSFRADITSTGAVVAGNQFIGVVSGNPTTQSASVVVIYDQPSVAYSGRAIGVVSKVLTNITRVVDTGALPPSGGSLTPAPVVNIKGIPGLLASKTLSASTLGAGGGVISTAEVDGTKINALGSLISAEVISSTAIAECKADGTARAIGSSTFADLKVANLLHLPITFKPNTTLLNLLGLVKVVVNQQIKTGTGGSKTITVNALRVTTPLTNKLLGNLLGLVPNGTVADITVASANAGVKCSTITGPALTLVDGADFAFKGFDFKPNLGTTAEKTFTFPAASVDRTARIGLYVADAEHSRPDTIVVKVGGNVVNTIFNDLDGFFGPNADLESIPVSIPAGATNVSVQLLSEGNSTPIGTALPDSIVWVWSFLSLPSGVSKANLFSGQATVLSASVLGVINAVVGDTGPIPSVGGELDATVNALPLLPLLASVTGEAKVKSAGEVSEASASVEKLGLNVLGIGIFADVLSTTAKAECKPDNTVALSGTSTVANLLVGGLPVALTGPLQIDIPLLGGKIVLNEKIVGLGSITVNALHIVVPNIIPIIGGDDLVNVTVASSHADIVCN